jgi:hypothetical protein
MARTHEKSALSLWTNIVLRRVFLFLSLLRAAQVIRQTGAFASGVGIDGQQDGE